MTSNKPYLVKAFYDWISDNELTPYIVVDVTVSNVLVPMNYVQNNEIVLNISYGAVGSISLSDHAIEFTARFGGKLESLYVPYGAIGAIYAKENGAGTALPIEDVELTEVEETLEDISLAPVSEIEADSDTRHHDDEIVKPEKKKPTLKVVK